MPRGGRGNVIFSYIRRLGSFLGVQNFDFRYFFFFFLGGGGGGFRKMNFLGGMKFLWIFFGSSQNWTIFRGYFHAFKGLF